MKFLTESTHRNPRFPASSMVFGRYRLLVNSFSVFCRGCSTVPMSKPQDLRVCAGTLYSRGTGLMELPRKLTKFEKKPWVTHITVVKRKSRLESRERRLVEEVTLKPPENGLLVKHLIPVAHKVMAARAKLLACLTRVAENIPIFVCRCSCGRSPHKIRTCLFRGKHKEHAWVRGGVDHLFPETESFHLYDRLGRAVSHDERLQVDRVPAILELCIQAGVDIAEYPTRRRKSPIYCVAGKTIDFEKRFPKIDLSGTDIQPCGFWEVSKSGNKRHECFNLQCRDIKDIAEMGMQAWENLHSGTVKLMEKYAVQTCGYCLEVQVGPKGHRVRQCQAFKHQMRDGQHAWQEAMFEDIVPPVYVWHVSDPNNRLLVDSLKSYYGMLPAVVELFVQAGAQVGDEYKAIMREDVVVPSSEEAMLVA